MKLKYFLSTDDLWRSCGGCNYSDDGTDIGAVKSKSSSLMVPRLAFQEWEGFNAGESAQQMTAAASRAWPGLTLLTLADIKTAAWLVENNHLTQLERITFTTDLHTQSVSEVQTIKSVAKTVSDKSDDQIFEPEPKGNLIATRTPEMFNLHIVYSSWSDLVNYCISRVKSKYVDSRCGNISASDPSYS